MQDERGFNVGKVFGGVQRFLTATSGWAILVPGAGAISAALLPWAWESISGFFSFASRPRLAVSFAKGGIWHPVFIAGGFGILCLLFVATYSSRPAPWWKALVLFTGGAGVIAGVIVFWFWLQGPQTATETVTENGQVTSQTEIPIRMDALEGVSAAFGCGQKNDHKLDKARVGVAMKRSRNRLTGAVIRCRQIGQPLRDVLTGRSAQ
jgi:hypothetical protein